MTARNAAALEQHDFDEYDHFVARGAADDDDAFSTRTTNTARARRTWKTDRTRRSTTMHLCRAVGDDADHLREAAQNCALNTILRDADKDPEALDPVLRHACAELRLRINQLRDCDDRELRDTDCR